MPQILFQPNIYYSNCKQESLFYSDLRFNKVIDNNFTTPHMPIEQFQKSDFKVIHIKGEMSQHQILLTCEYVVIT